MLKRERLDLREDYYRHRKEKHQQRERRHRRRRLEHHPHRPRQLILGWRGGEWWTGSIPRQVIRWVMRCIRNFWPVAFMGRKMFKRSLDAEGLSHRQDRQ